MTSHGSKYWLNSDPTTDTSSGGIGQSNILYISGNQALTDKGRGTDIDVPLTTATLVTLPKLRVDKTGVVLVGRIVNGPVRKDPSLKKF